MADQSAPADTLIVLTNLPDASAAHALAAHLVEARLAACVNVLAPCRSVYRWQGGIADDSEVPMLIKTTRARYDALEAAIRARHPYELPEIVAVPVERALPAYAAWVAGECAASPDAPESDPNTTGRADPMPPRNPSPSP